MCNGQRPDDPHGDPRRGTPHPIPKRERERLRRHHEEEARKGGFLSVITPALGGLTMCNHDSDDPDDYGPPTFGPVRHHRHRGEAIPPEDHRGLFFRLAVAPLFLLACGGNDPRRDGLSDDDVRTAMKGKPFRRWDLDPRRDADDRPHRFARLALLPLLVLACRDEPPSGPYANEEDDPIHHRLKEGGPAIRKHWGLFRRLALAPVALALCLTEGKDATNDQRNKPGPIFKLMTAPFVAVAALAACNNTGPSDPPQRRTRDYRPPHPRDIPKPGTSHGGWMSTTPALALAPLPAGASAMCDDQERTMTIWTRNDPGSGPGAGLPFLTSAGGRLLRSGRPIAWFRWVFLDLERHEADCKWAATLRLLGIARTA